ncbi:wd repeat-containing protein pop1 [Anaeramoeba flamelloides]|uniref:Wd repeat-containing protein pop1 n=1 Tax=Anaeramoeba flamelloides TaxID=1746091 RepID=A0AAV7Z0F0_9EUKA|nr:wd repeat-containing protein pop1 [Anaeramoeba flamelloides]
MTEDIPVVNPLGTFQGHLSGINGISLYESHLFTCSDDKTVKKWTLEGENVQHFLGHNARITGMKLVNEVLYTGSHDKTAMSWSLRTGKVLKEFIGHEDRLSCLLVKDGRMFTGSADHTVRVWDTQSGNCQQIFRDHTDQISGLVYKNNTLLTSSVDKTIRVWSTETGQCKKVLSGHKSWILAQYFDEVNDVLYTASKDGEIKCWDLKSYECVSSFKAHKFAIIKLELHNKLVYSASWDGTIGCIDSTQNKLVRSLEGHDGKVSTFGIFQNNLYSGGRDRTVRVWNLKNGKCEYVYLGHRGVVQNLSFTETEIFSVGSDGNLIKWPAIKSIGKKKSKSANQNRSEKNKRARRIRLKTNNPDEKFVYYLFDQYDDLKQKIERVIQCGRRLTYTSKSNLKYGNKLSKSIFTFVESEQDSICQLFPEDIGDIYQIPLLPFLHKYGNIREQIEKKRKIIIKFMKRKFLPQFKNFRNTVLKEFNKKIQDYDFATKEYLTLKSNQQKNKKKTKKNDQASIDLFEKAKGVFLESKKQIVEQLERIETTEMFKLINMICQFFQIQTEYFSDCYDLINQIGPFTSLIISKIALKQSLNKVLMSNINWLKQSVDKPLIRESQSQDLIKRQKFNNSFTSRHYSQLTKEHVKKYPINQVGNKNQMKKSATQSLENQNNIKISNFKAAGPFAVSILPNYSTEEGQLQFEDDQLIEIIEKGDLYSLGKISEKQGKFLSNLVMFVSEEQAKELGYIEQHEEGLSLTKKPSNYIKSRESDPESDKSITLVSKIHKSLTVSLPLNSIVSYPEKPIKLSTPTNHINTEYKNDSFLPLEKKQLKEREKKEKDKIKIDNSSGSHISTSDIGSISHTDEDN